MSSSLSLWRALLCGLLGLPGLLHAGAAAAQPPTQGLDRPLVISFADVGQGDAALIITPDGKHILIDAGPTPDAMERMFFESVFDTLDLVIASHGHADHIGGMPWVFDRFVVRAYLDNGIPHRTNIYRRTMMAAEREPGLQYLQATSRTITVGLVTLHILSPSLLDASQNNNSVGVILEYGTFRAIFTGDAERKQLEHWLRLAKIPRVDLVKSAHHGARNGVTPEWIAATQPKVVIISVSARNAYGHPSAEVVRAWIDIGARLYRTDIEGSIVLGVQGDGKFHVTTSRNVLSVPIRK